MDRLDKTLFELYCDDNGITDKTIRQNLFNFLDKLANSTYSNFEDIPYDNTTDDTLKRLGIRPEIYMELIFNLTLNSIFNSTSNVLVYATDGRVAIKTRQVLTEHGICYMTNTVLDPKYSAEFAIFGRLPPPSSNKPDSKDVLKGSYFDADVTIDFFGFLGNGVDSYLHSTHDVARVDKHAGMLTEAIQYTAFSMEITTAPKFERDVTISQRKCRFHHESNLTHFPVYTKNLCLQECRLNLAFKLCGCIPHFYPNRIPKPKPVCHYKKLRECFPPHALYLQKLYRTRNDVIDRAYCQCLQNCDDTIVTINKALLLTATKSLFSESLGVRMTVDSWPMKRLKRQVVFTAEDLLVSIGSTAGLFLGFSVLSAIEFLYFFTIRLFFHSRGFRMQ